MATVSKGYLGLGYVPSLILAIIPVTSCIFGLITAAQKKKWFWFIVRLLLGWNIIWVVDLVDMIVNKKLTWLI
ncbi:MAG: hypothetical protein RR338_06330 [Clostridia bacterium]